MSDLILDILSTQKQLEIQQTWQRLDAKKNGWEAANNFRLKVEVWLSKRYELEVKSRD